MKYNLILIAGFLLLQLQAVKGQGHADIVEHKDTRLDVLLKKNVSTTCAFPGSHNYPGYGILALSSSNRELIMKTKAKLLAFFPDQRVSLGYKAPYFKLTIGEFTEHGAAALFATRVSKKLQIETSVVAAAISFQPGDDK